MRMLHVLCVSLLGLLGCSARTVYTVNTDLIPFIPADKRGGSFNNPTDFSLTVPGDAGQRIPVPEGIFERGRLTVRFNLQNSGSAPLTATLQGHIGAENDTNVTDSIGGDVRFGQIQAEIAPGQNQVITLSETINTTTNTPVYNLVRSGVFRAAFKLNVSSGSVAYSIQEGSISLTVRPFALIK
jgi:hypothetical protein